MAGSQVGVVLEVGVTCRRREEQHLEYVARVAEIKRLLEKLAV